MGMMSPSADLPVTNLAVARAPFDSALSSVWLLRSGWTSSVRFSRSCATCEIAVEILTPEATTMIVLEGNSSPMKTLGSITGDAKAWLDEQILFGCSSGLKIQQFAVWSENR